MIHPREWIHYIKWRIKKLFQRRKFVSQRP
jgi:hypothetical protein